MKTWNRCRGAFFFLLGMFVAVSQAGASTHPLNIEESFQGVFGQLYAPVEGFRLRQRAPAPEVPYSRLLEVSRTVFASSPEAERELDHLRPVVDKDLISAEGWDEFNDFEGTLDRSLVKRGVFFSPGMRRKIYLVGAGLMWHQAQHLYDSQAPYAKAAEAAGGGPLDSLEAEVRGWRAGCSFWKAGNGMNVSMGGKSYADALSCEHGFPKAFHCRYNSTAELVILTNYKIRLLARLGGEVQDEGTGPAPDLSGAMAGLEAELAGYCAEFERASKGNPLSLSGFKFEWSAGRCIEKAVETVNAPGWKGSKELCGPDSDGSGPKHVGFEPGN